MRRTVDFTNIVRTASILLLPFALLVIGRLLLHELLPVFSGPNGFDADPAYVYLFSGLTIIDGNTPSHVDHPGTPLQTLTAMVVSMQWLLSHLSGGSGRSDIVSTAIAAPEDYIRTVCTVLLALNCLAAAYLGRAVYRATGSMSLAMFTQCAPVAYGVVAPRLAYYAPEALLICTSMCLLGLLAPFLFSAGNSGTAVPRRVPMLAGIVCGVGLAVKVTFLPMLGLVLLLRNRRAVVATVVCTALAWCVCVIPILSRIRHMAEWFVALMLHSGHYGTGAEDVMRIDVAQGSMQVLLRTFPFFFAILLFLAAHLLVKASLGLIARCRTSASLEPPAVNGRPDWRKLALHCGTWHTPVVILATCLLQTVLVLKHPGVHYMVPVLPLAFIGAAWLAHGGNTVMLAPSWRAGLQAMTLAGGLAMVAQSTATITSTLRTDRVMRDASVELLQDALQNHPGAVVIGTYRCPLPQCALAFGAGYASDLAKKVAPALADFNTFNIWNGKILVYGTGWRNVDLIASYLAAQREVFLVSPDYPQLQVFQKSLVIQTPISSLYKVTGVAHS